MIGNIAKYGMLAAGGNMLLHSFMPQYGVNLAHFLPGQSQVQSAAANMPVRQTTIQTTTPLSSLVSSAIQVIPNVLSQNANGLESSTTTTNQNSAAQPQAISYNTPPKWYW